MTNKYRIYDLVEKQYVEEPDFRWMFSRSGKLYNSETDEWHDVGVRYLVEFSTGLKDKNGVEIFEGDVLQLDCFKQGLGAYAKNVVVSYEVLDANDGTQWSWFTLTDSKDKTELAFLRSKNMLVIGNIHDKLELIK